MKAPSPKLFAAIAATLVLTGCPSSPTEVRTVHPSCTQCGISATLHRDGGTEVWSASNDTDAPMAMPVSIAGMRGQAVSLVFFNDSGKAQPMPPIRLESAPTAPSPAARRRVGAAPDDGLSQADRIRAFNHDGWARQLERMRAARAATPPVAENRSGAAVAPATVGDTRGWYHDDEETPRQTTLVRQGTLRDGVMVNIWIEDGENDQERVTDDALDTMLNAYRMTGGIYEFLYDIGGPMWGPTKESELIPGTGQPINVVLLNLGDDLGGYFLAANAFVNQPDTETARSNAAVAVFINTTPMYATNPGGLGTQLLTLAHESVHMQNFYRRGVTLGADYMFDDWLDEGSAVMVEDFVSQRLLQNYNEVRDSRLPQYLSTPHYGCNLLQWPQSRDICDGYAVWGAWGGYLNRQLGMAFYRNLLNDRTNQSSEAVLDAAIRSVRPDSGMVPEMRRWSATVGAMIPAAGLPSGYGYPERTDTGYPLPDIDLQTLVDKRKLPTSTAAPLAGYSMFPVVRRGVVGTFSETVTVPPRTTLSVVVHGGKV
ncbi:hemagglutinin [Cupriavidus sp.]|uniref:M30 family zinc metallopeptidase n=1 Tax=Cupriavidus sp. TaxID=1873897 RepID=UPI0025B8F78B|nr:hemagglutinin [Cupriavidus sp.]MCA3186027.1 hemagglutinin [Cupriavidus sp.]MCA3194571.1 hemagglutinin [Cupriavidus sp.]MCA3199914.1 hemagglutinin [Cupriavidus sp.]MCA3205574.1 hemagglutinin [Cupriavidus sp.]MCA3205925.1 hemagglutinin [Cupriavidus sp.]